MEIRFSTDVCQNLATSLRLEWLETDGLGGYATSTILDCHTRKYHGLLVVPSRELDGKFNLLSKLETALRVGDRRIDLASNAYDGMIHPQGWLSLVEFTQGYLPSATYSAGGVTFRRSLMLLRDEHTLLVRYDLLSSSNASPVMLELTPLLAFRNMHALTKRNDLLDPNVAKVKTGWVFQPYKDLPQLFMSGSSRMRFTAVPDWYHNVEYIVERERGFDFTEDLFRPGYFETPLELGKPFIMRASIAPPKKDPLVQWERELKRREKLGEAAAASTGAVSFATASTSTDTIATSAAAQAAAHEASALAMLKVRAEQFIITNARGRRSIVAGYPWFAEWGRDAMIALPGLTVHSGRSSDALAVLRTFVDHRMLGLIPNYLGVDTRGDAYNSVDASLWLFWACQEYLTHSGDLKGVMTQLFDGLVDILFAFASNTVPNVTLRDDGMIWCGNRHTQLTWMDATVAGQPVTPRHGLAIELNAMWYNALRFYQELCTKSGRTADPQLLAIADRCGDSLPRTFWIADAGYLADVVNDQGQDRSLRPNQLVAIALPYSVIDTQLAAAAVNLIRAELATPYGMRTLSPLDPAYRPYYRGSSAERDGAYHQGTVWPWLTGWYVAAALRVATNRRREARRLAAFFSPLIDSHLREAGLLGISEIMSAEPPHTPDGCISQAWSVAEVIRAYNLLRDVDNG